MLKWLWNILKGFLYLLQDAAVKLLLSGYIKRTKEKSEKLHKENQEKMDELEKRADNLLKRIDDYESTGAGSGGHGSGDLQ